ncbi:MAG: hypothetical protein COV34_01740 [Candidatus Zambryskibacteria bacterium CG10_big_fil_rev_8_21_14_0_10_42_12]|uniref:Uncharacterized protein n=1 Tax=Candidatus Zambryskibacteria bacterium CG10_big_fil_rev_8_21_14_0_10_42_12 TaxID=1975115 RepID=A0A2H0QVK0_9BACT|nr:MAG: hypothetical protein COV34_01740 [Candidatus Zambryskibacteria bacterium CG10_big_fil_rev_8_21_14_0_10_42_12]
MKTFYIILGILLVVLGGFWLLGSREAGDDTQNITTELTEYFAERMTTLGVRGGMMPIEGFDAGLLIGAFPGLIKADFQDVETFEGHYEIQAGELVFVRDQEQPISSAERTVSNEGYGTLLQNLSTRLDMTVNSESDIDAIIDTINISEIIETKIDQGASAYSITIVPQEVLEDSRCPIDVECIQAGTVRVKAVVESDTGSAEYIFEPFSTLTIDAIDVTLVQVAPMPESGVTIDQDTYAFVFEVVDRT